MTIGFDGSRAFGERTGTENYSYQLLKNLSQIDTKNNYLIYLRPGNQVKALEWPDNFKFKKLSYPRFWTQLGLAIELFLHRPDLLFVPAHTYPIIRPKELKIVMTIHDLGAEYLPSTHQVKQRLYLQWITKYQIKHATKLIAVSEATKKDLLQKTDCASDQIEVIYEGVDLEKFKPLRPDILKDIFKSFDIKNHQYFLFVGTVQPRKNLSRLIEAFASYAKKQHSVKLVIAGGKGWLSDEIYALPKKLSIDKQVIFTGRVSDEQLVALYQGAIALTYPSLFEGFGLPILEAFASKCPVLTSDHSAMSEIASSAAIQVDAEDSTSIEKGLELISQPKVAQSLVSKGEERVKSFSWEKAARATLKLFEKLIG